MLSYLLVCLCMSGITQAQTDSVKEFQIVKFEPKVENTVRNFLPANTLVTAWSYGALNQKDEAIRFIDRQIKYFPDYKLILWSKSVYIKDNSITLAESEKDANARIIEQLIKQGF